MKCHRTAVTAGGTTRTFREVPACLFYLHLLICLVLHGQLDSSREKGASRPRKASAPLPCATKTWFVVFAPSLAVARLMGHMLVPAIARKVSRYGCGRSTRKRLCVSSFFSCSPGWDRDGRRLLAIFSKPITRRSLFQETGRTVRRDIPTTKKTPSERPATVGLSEGAVPAIKKTQEAELPRLAKVSRANMPFSAETVTHIRPRIFTGIEANAGAGRVAKSTTTRKMPMRKPSAANDGRAS